MGAPVATLNGSLSQSIQIYTNWRQYFRGLVAGLGGVNLANRLSTFARDTCAELEGAYVNGQKYRTTNRNGVVVYDV